MSDPTPEPTGGSGALQEGLDHRAHQRGTLKMIEQGVRGGWIKLWELPAATAAQLPRMLLESIERSYEAQDDRSLRDGIRVALAMQKANLETAKAVDEHLRLEAGEATTIAQQDVTLKVRFDGPGVVSQGGRPLIHGSAKADSNGST